MCGYLAKSQIIKPFVVSLLATLAITLGVAITKADTNMVSLLPNGPGRPFTWTSYPTTEIGIADARNATEVTPSGSLQTASCNVMLMSGESDRPVNASIRKLDRGYLPIVHYHFYDHSVRYDVTMFSWALSAQKPYRSPINFIRIRAFNYGKMAATSWLTLALSYGAGQHRFVFNHKPPVNPKWIYGFHDGMALRANRVMFTFPAKEKPEFFISLGKVYSQPQTVKASDNTPVLLVRYAMNLKSGQQTELVFKMPVHPIVASDAVALRQLQKLRCPAALAACRAWWREQIRGQGLQLYLNESKVVATFRASLMYLMLARERLPAQRPSGKPVYVQDVNKLQYHAFWFRDGSYMVRAYDLTGHSRRAHQCLRYFLAGQSPDGDFVSQVGQNDGWGEALWAIGQYVEVTGNMKFAREAFPHVRKAVAWLETARKRNPLHVLPTGAPHDDEFPNNTTAYLTGDNFYGLDGLHQAILLARALGHTATAAAWQKEYNNYHHAVFSRLRQIGKSDGDYMPPALDVKGGNDWGNLLALYPHELLSPNDPLVTRTLRHTLAEYGEGLMEWEGMLHDYLGMDNTESYIIRGEQRSALRDLYAVLVHTSATQAGWEIGPRPWSSRNFHGDLAPHGWFAADYIAMVRNMLIRGQGRTLQLFSALSPKWTQPGDIISLYRTPTRFGFVSVWAVFTNHGMVLHIHGNFRYPPEGLRVHIPWYVSATSATADGKPLIISKASLVLPPHTRVVRILWKRNNNLEVWSYRAFVKRFQQAWQARYFDHKAMAFGNGLHVWPK